MEQEIPQSPAQLTPGWLTEALRADGAIGSDAAVSSLSAETVGEGAGFIGLLARVHLQYSGNAANAPVTVIAKFPSQAEGARAIGKLYGVYEREVRFYAEIGDAVGLNTPHCYYSALDLESDRYFLLLEDLATSGRVGDQVAGCSEDEALLAVRELAKLHARWWDSSKFPEVAWVPRGSDLVRASMQALYPQSSVALMEEFGERLTDEIAGEMATLGQRVLAALPQLETRPETVIHADYRLDNMFFGAEGAPYELAVFDWQATNRSNGSYDLAYFVSGCMAPERRRACEARLIQAYHEALLERGVPDYPIDELLDDYRRSLVLALAIMTVSGATLERTNERAVKLWEGLLDGLVTSITDHNALQLLPAAP